MQAEKRAIGRSHVIVFGLIITAIFFWLLFARPRLLGQGQPTESQSAGASSTEKSSEK